MRRRIAAWVCALACLAGPALAQSDAVACVQSQLQAAGQDPGPVDGFPGRRTRAAITAFAEAQGKLDLPILTEDNGVVLCRLIGLADPSLQSYWPSADTPIEISAGAGVAGNVEGATYAMARETLRRFAVDYDIRLPLPVRIVLAEGEAEFARMMTEASDGTLRNLDERAEYHCNDGAGVSGVTYGTLIGICLVPGQQLGRGIVLEALNIVVAHEIVHSAQRQLAGRAARGNSFQDFVDHRGPLWLTEGTATVIAEAIVTGLTFEDRFLRPLEDELTRIGWPDLSRHELRPNGARETNQLYSGGTLAVARLLSPDPEALERIFRFYEAIGLGERWQDAFATQFGLPHEEAYLAFQALDPGTGHPTDAKTRALTPPPPPL